MYYLPGTPFTAFHTSSPSAVTAFSWSRAHAAVFSL